MRVMVGGSVTGSVYSQGEGKKINTCTLKRLGKTKRQVLLKMNDRRSVQTNVATAGETNGLFGCVCFAPSV